MDQAQLIKNLAKHLNQQLVRIILSDPRQKNEPYYKGHIKPFMKDETLYFQLTFYTKTQVFHENLSKEALLDRLTKLIDQTSYRQWQGETKELAFSIRISKKGAIHYKEKGHQAALTTDLSHNRTKHYLLEEGVAVPYLVQLGVMTEEGKVLKKRYDKFKQINRFLEMVRDILPSLPTHRPIEIIDFGCGRSYLTFALYHYLTTIEHLEVSIIGLDLKAQVIEDCNNLAKACHYDHLTFLHGDILEYEDKQRVDMVVTLHACDTATDLALKKAVKWGAKAILSVPCCQHELNGQIHHDGLAPILEYGILKERMAALITDGVRANWLKLMGYEVSILEFIDVSHTPKNLLIRAVKTASPDPNSIDFTELDAFIESLGANLTIRW